MIRAGLHYTSRPNGRQYYDLSSNDLPSRRVEFRKAPLTGSRKACALRYPVQAGLATELHNLQAIDISSENFRPFGQLSGPVDDGKQYDEQDAQLVLDKGTPRFYIMRLPSRGVAFDRITYHAQVTQCLGGLGEQPWFLAVAEPSGSVEAWPQLSDLHVFRGLEQRKLCRIPPGVFIKLHQATWHAGPFFQEAQHMDFYNLELSDTNIADHCTHVYEGMQLVINTKRTMYDTFEP